MGLHEYPVTVDGTPTVLLLSDADAAALGLHRPAAAPAEDAVAGDEPPAAGADPETAPAAGTKQAAPADKQRRAADKQA